MPQLTNEEFFKLIRSIESELVPLSISLNSEKEAIALKECDDYFNNKISNINDISPLAVYYIISKLDSKKQIEFLRKNIDYIKKHDNEIFMYTLMSPNSLSYYFSFEVIKELKKIDRDICIKVITSNQDNLFKIIIGAMTVNFLIELVVNSVISIALSKVIYMFKKRMA